MDWFIVAGWFYLGSAAVTVLLAPLMVNKPKAFTPSDVMFRVLFYAVKSIWIYVAIMRLS